MNWIAIAASALALIGTLVGQTFAYLKHRDRLRYSERVARLEQETEGLKVEIANCEKGREKQRVEIDALKTLNSHQSRQMASLTSQVKLLTERIADMERAAEANT